MCDCHPDYHAIGVHAPTQTAGPPLGEEGGPAPTAAPDAASSRQDGSAGGSLQGLPATQALLLTSPADALRLVFLVALVVGGWVVFGAYVVGAVIR